jgi:thymidylate synthase ThyX
MSVKLISYSQPSDEVLENGISDIKDLVGYCARISNPSNQMNTQTTEKLINYLIRNKHWSPLEMVSICLEINTTRDIARQILRHRSFSFQEFCVSKGTMIKCFSIYQNMDIDIPIEMLYTEYKNNEHNKYYIYMYSEEEKIIKYSTIKEVFTLGFKSCYKVQIHSNNNKKLLSIECTGEHKFFTSNNEFKQLKELQIGDKILITPNNNCNDIEYAYIVSKIDIGLKETYDIEVDNASHNYIANGIISHNSQRYADPLKDLSFSEPKEARIQDLKNRQNSISVDDAELEKEWKIHQQNVIDVAKEAYTWASSKGIAKEVARVVLPEGLCMSRMYVNGTVRSWHHFCDLRSGNGTQLEHQIIAKECIKVIRTIYSSFCSEIDIDNI